MITGANTNVRHRGIVFHVQTEDSGRANPHIISHLYHHGTILASRKTDYAAQVDAEDLERVVRGLIETQHKAMLKSLTAGEYDELIDERLGEAGEAANGKARRKSKKQVSEEVDDGPKTDGIETPTPLPELGADPPPRSAPRPAATASTRTFGEGIVSQKPLDEVILEYLAEKARDRAADRADKAAQKSRSSG